MKNMKILANDGLSAKGVEMLVAAGFEVLQVKVAQEQLANYINQNNVNALLVRSATKVRRDVIDACPGLKLIGRGGVGMDNIDVDYALERGINVISTPASSSQSVAELVFAHLFTGVRFLHDANRMMPLEGESRFEALKKSYSAGTELRGKTLGIIGFGRIGHAVARMALGLGMRVIASDKYVGKGEVRVDFYNGQFINVEIITEPVEDILRHADFITLHVPAMESGYLIGADEFEAMKPGVGIINCSRGGIIDEVALIDALDSDKVAFAGLDVFEDEPTPAVQVLMHPQISLSPHIGGSTLEAQERIGLELAEQTIKHLAISS